MRNSSKMLLGAAAAAVVASIIPSTVRATDYTWAGATGPQTWNDASKWTPNTGFPSLSGDTANLAVPLAGSLGLNLTGDVTVGSVSIGGTGPAVTTDVGNGSTAFKVFFNNTGGANNSDGNSNASINSIGTAGSTNLFSAPVALQANLSILKTSTSSLSLNGGIQIDSAAGAASARTLVVNLTSPNVLNIGDLTSISTTAPTAGITNQIQIATANDSATTQWGTVNLNGVISNGGAIGGFNVNTRLIFGSGGANNNNNTIATINVNGNNTFSGGAQLFRANVVLGTDTAFGTSTVSFGGGATANSTGYNLLSTDDARTMGNALTMQRNLTVTGAHSLTWAGTMTQSNASNLFNLLPADKTLTFTGVGGLVGTNSTAGVAIATDTNGTGRLFTFDGPGKTVVNGNVVNNNNGGLIDVVTAGGSVSTLGQIAKNGTGLVVLGGTANTYGQFTAVNGGTLEFTQSGAVGKSASAVVNPGGAIGLDTGSLASFTHPTLGTTSLPALIAAGAQPSTGSLALSSADVTANADFTTAPLSSANAAGLSLGALAGTVNYAGTITPAAAGYRLGGGTGTLSLGTANALTGARALTVTNGGNVVLGAANNYTGATTVQGNYIVSVAGFAATNSQYQTISVANNNAPLPVLESTTLSVAKIADGDSSIGGAAPAASNLVINGGVLRYTGAAATTSRGFSIGTLGATLDASGGGAVNFASTDAVGLPEIAAGVVTGTTAASNNNVTAVNDASGLTVGMTVTGANIPAGTTITGIRPNFGTTSNVPNAINYTIYLSANATLAATATPLTFTTQNRTLTLTGTNTGANTVAGVLGNSANGTLAINKTGAGKWVLGGTNTYTGGTTVSAGTLSASNGDAFAGGAVTVANGATGAIEPNTAKAVTLNTLALNTSGKFDITNNSMVIRGMTLAQVQAMVVTAFNAGHWNGANGGLTSSTAAANALGTTAVGIGGNDVLNKTAFKGVTPLNPTDVLVKYTYYGDADLSGATTLDDFTLFLNGYQNSGTTWSKGDFDYSGLVTLDDFTLFLKGYQQQGAQLNELEALINSMPMSESQRSAMLAAVQAVPEPTGLALLGIGAAGLLGRRRRRTA